MNGDLADILDARLEEAVFMVLYSGSNLVSIANYIL